MTSPNTELLALAERFPEINLCNYDEGDVEALQAWAFEAHDAIRTAASHEAEIAACKAEIERLEAMVNVSVDCAKFLIETMENNWPVNDRNEHEFFQMQYDLLTSEIERVAALSQKPEGK